MANKVEQEQKLRAHLNRKGFVNENTNNEEWSKEDKVSLEKALSFKDYVARVIAATGSAVKVKWFKDNKPVAPYYSRDFDVDEALKFIKGFVKL